MARGNAIAVLQANAEMLRVHGIRHAARFGSLACGEARPDSDIDVVVDIEPERRFSLIDLASLRVLLCDLFDRETDVVVREDLRPAFRDRILRESVAVC